MCHQHLVYSVLRSRLRTSCTFRENKNKKKPNKPNKHTTNEASLSALLHFLFKIILFIFYFHCIYLFCACMCIMHICVSKGVRTMAFMGGQRTTCKSCFSPFTCVPHWWGGQTQVRLGDKVLHLSCVPFSFVCLFWLLLGFLRWDLTVGSNQLWTPEVKQPCLNPLKIGDSIAVTSASASVILLPVYLNLTYPSPQRNSFSSQDHVAPAPVPVLCISSWFLPIFPFAFPTEHFWGTYSVVSCRFC